jgi:hypothetical protein
MVGPPPSFISQKHFRFAREMLRRCLCQIILADPVEQRLANANLYRALIFVRSSAGPHASLRRAPPLRRHRLPHNPQSLFVLGTRHWRASDFDRGLRRQTQRQLFKKSLLIRV